jgi:hypothetical protein
MSGLDLPALRELGSLELDALMRAGYPIDPAALADTEYDGVSLNLPRWLERLTWVKFQKVFHRDPATGQLRGWNCKVRQGPLEEPWTKALRRGVPATYGHYRVVSAEGIRLPRPYGSGGVVLDYGALKDPLVSLVQGSVDLLLGWSFLDVRLAQLPTPSFFALRRAGPLSHLAPPT